MCTIVPFPSRPQSSDGAACIAGSAESAGTQQMEPVKRLEQVILDLHRANEELRSMIARIVNTEARQQLLADASVINALIDVLTARVRQISQTAISQACDL